MTLKRKEVEVLRKCVCGRSKFIAQVVAQPTVWLTVAVVSKLYPVLLRLHGISPTRILEWLPFPFPRDLPDPSDMPLPLSHQGSPFGLLHHPTYTLLLQSPTMYLFSNSLHFACIFWKNNHLNGSYLWSGILQKQ